MKKIVAIGSAAAILLAGCASHKAAKTVPFQTTYGQDAATVAAHVPGCTGIQAERAGDFIASASSAATCTIQGHKVVIYTWPSMQAEDAPISSLNGSQAHARGTGWTELITDTAAPDAQQSIAQVFVTALSGGTIRTD